MKNRFFPGMSCYELRSITKAFIATSAFLCAMAWVWRLPDIFNTIPDYGDSLEVIWGILWYNRNLLAGNSPLQFPNMFAPTGFEVGTLAHSPFFFLVAQPFHLIGGAVFAYNALSISGFAIAYAGMYRLLNKHYDLLLSITGALTYTFFYARLSRVVGHLHIFLATAFAPLFVYYLLEMLEDDSDGRLRSLVAMGVLWGVMINFSLYSIFLVPLIIVTLGGTRLLQYSVMLAMVKVGIVALLVGTVTLVPYYLGSQTVELDATPFGNLVFWSTTLDCLATPTKDHPLKFMQGIRSTICSPGHGEATDFPFGITMTLLFVASLIQGKNLTLRERGFRRMALVGLMLGFGLVLYHRNALVELSWLEGINQILWGWGHALKPDVFGSGTVPGQFEQAVPLPGYILLIFLPFYEGARVFARYLFVALIGVIFVNLRFLKSLPPVARVPLIGLILFELVGYQVRPQPLNLETLEIHPAQAWVKVQNEATGRQSSIIELRRGGLFSSVEWGSQIFLSSLLSELPTASGGGSFTPALHNELYRTSNLREPDARTISMLKSVNVEYGLIREDSAEMWNSWSSTPTVEPIGCFPGVPDSPWSHSVCVAQLLEFTGQPELAYGFGWSSESWGRWAIDRNPHAEFFSGGSQPLNLLIEAFPFCDPKQNQSLRILLNNEEVGQIDWSDACETQQVSFPISAEQNQSGWNSLDFRFSYAISPSEVDLSNIDPRVLAVGFNRLEVLSAGK